ncbi:helix-turn-helix transcriptional regulator [bacterium]|nr:helix-turn-helix transcriptional regulator [bacterium]
MKLLTRAEELVLLAVWRLKEEAYCVPIREMLMEATELNWSFGSIYDALDRLEKKGYLRSSLSDPIASRGGRSKRIYAHTADGIKAMNVIRKVQRRMWDGIGDFTVEKLS